MNAIDLLTKQHKLVERALETMLDSDSIDDDDLVEVADQLVAHMVIEEHIFYPRVRELRSELVSESYEEHTVARFELGRALGAKGDEKKSRVTVLKELVFHHIEEEESEMFPQVRSGISQRELEALGTRMEAMFQRATNKGFAGLLVDGYELRRGPEDGRRGAGRQRATRPASRASRASLR
jgi:hemerythrin superfamily protein